MAGQLQGTRVAVLVANSGVEQVELTRPWDAVKEAGGELDLLAPDPGEVQAFDHLEPADTFQADRALAGAREAEYDGLLLPGGVANPDELRQNRIAVAFVRSFFESGKPVAAICHAPWMLIEAGVVEGRTITSWPSLETDVENAGGRWVDREVQVDGNLITSRKPEDLDAFCTTAVEAFAGAGRDAPALS